MLPLQDVLSVLALLVVVAIGVTIYLLVRWSRQKTLPYKLMQHFAQKRLDQLAVAERQFPAQIRADVQRGIESFIAGELPAKAPVAVRSFFGVYSDSPYGDIDFNDLLKDNLIDFGNAAKAGPPQYEQLDIGEAEPLPVLKSGLWLLNYDDVRIAILFSGVTSRMSCGSAARVRVQIATPRDERGVAVAQRLFQHLESEVATARSYRGKVLSLEVVDEYSGQASGVKVHRLSRLARDQVILPEQTLELLERNVMQFVRLRDMLKQQQMAAKKGLLFYGPPGTGKTHTIRYLAGTLPDHTTLLITAEQIGLLGEYLTLARLLQPSIVVIEDVDLIARERRQSRNAGTELMLNKLLNEMDGLREDSEILFILTTNRPEDLEQALASRPGRIDQAIEFPLPDAAGRAKLVELYARGMPISAELIQQVVERTERVSASFIKELMRRAAQFHFESNGTPGLTWNDISRALDDMLFRGGSLNLKLLGGEGHLERVESPRL